MNAEHDAKARELHRHLSIIAAHAREKAMQDNMSHNGTLALRGIASAIPAIANHAGVICHADAGDELGALCDAISDICAAVVREHLEPEYTDACRADERSKAMREDAQ